MMKFKIICLFLSLKIIGSFGKETLCSSNAACDCIQKTHKMVVNCQRVANMKDVQSIFSKDLNFKPVSSFSTKSCTAESLPNSIFWNTTIRYISSVCPFKRVEDDALTPIEGLSKLDLRFTKFSKIPIAISKLTRLKILHINDGKLTGVDTELQNMTNLLQLKLINNNISQISPEAFSKNSNLNTIELPQNKLIFLYPGIFDGCRKLNKIFLQKNGLKSVDGLFNIPSLKEIHLEVNNLTSIDNAFQKDINLEFLHLNTNPLRKISSSAFNANVKHLRALTLRKCELKFLSPSVFRHLTKLKLLDLSNNLIESLPVEIFHGLHSLLHVDLKENRISYLGEVFRHNYHLQSVMLTSNNLQTVKNLFRGLEYLNTVDLRYNNLTVITETDFSTMVSMRSLRLSNNSIYRIDSNAFLNMARLKNLSLEFNKLTTLNGSLRNSRDLKFLWLHHNQLKEIEESEMSNLRKLMRLNLSFNNLTNVHKAFKNLTHLKILNLYQNKLTTLSRSTFPPRLNIKKFGTRANPWRCDCRLSWLLEIPKLANQLKCIFPEEFFNETVGQLNIHNLTNWSDNCDSSCECTCVPQENEFFVRVDCSGRNMTQVPAALPEKVGELHLQNNLLSNLINLKTHSLAHLRYLDVERNFLTEIGFYFPKNLETVKLARNNLTRFMSYYALPTILSWTLSDNPWICDCDTVDFWKFLNSESEKILDVNSVICNHKEGKPKLNGKNICDLTKYELCPEKLILYILLGVGLSELEDKEPFYSLFVPPRDMQAGRFEIDQQLEEMKNSKRIIIIVSQSFIDSEVNMEIFRVAFASGLEEKIYRIIPIVVGTLPPLSDLDPSLKVALESTQCLRLGQKLFWEMIRYAMPDKSHIAEASLSEEDLDMPLLNAW
ncbi:Carboxypeptidase N subunit 2 [Araneus ventricosus]|uniref:Carboxypeptidase N subunit 2 n=1 Tax=Araneus ventricosus TaxID=182803 RepID=A0A4Y2G1D3_ARAVE|nr:Carboxypeptidase N subunit 2 [Araneus ventricosus]